MRYAPDRKEKTRAKILEAAGKVFRRQGYHASGVDKVMEEAGLTAGGFYAHFESKQALLAEALTHSAAEASARQEEGLEALSGREWVEAFLSRYLGTKHRRNVDDGCPLVALVSEVARTDEPVRTRFETLVRGFRDKLAENVSEEGQGPVGERALAALALCVGGLGLARSVQDETLAEQILASCRNQARLILSGDAGPSTGSRSRRKPRDP